MAVRSLWTLNAMIPSSGMILLRASHEAHVAVSFEDNGMQWGCPSLVGSYMTQGLRQVSKEALHINQRGSGFERSMYTDNEALTSSRPLNGDC